MTEIRRIPVECWTRTVGYFRPTKTMHKAKQDEVEDRKLYDTKQLSNILKDKTK
jgi:anaerobic ribonucleoside-triphosphate reductase